MHDPGHLLFRKALRIAIVLPCAYLFAMYVLKIPAGASYTVFGTFVLLSFSDFGGPTKDRARAYIVTGLVGIVAVVLGTLGAVNPWVAIGSTLVVGAVLSFAGVLRGYVAAATMSVLLPFIIAVTSGPGLDQLPQRLMGFAVAIVFATGAALLLWPAHIRSSLRQRVAETLDASANVIRTMWPDPNKPAPAIDLATRQRELSEAHHRMREQYDGRAMRPGGATSRDRALMQTIDELGRLRIFLRWEPDSVHTSLSTDPQLAQQAAQAVADSAAAIGRGGSPPQTADLDATREAHREDSEHWVDSALERGASATIRPTLNAGFQLRLVAVISELIARHSRVAVGAEPEQTALTSISGPMEEPEPTPGQILRSQLNRSSPWLRNALRSGFALAIAVGVVYATSVDHGFWVVLGTLTALRFDVLGTGKTALQAIIGTVGGFVVGTGVILLLGDNEVALWILLPIVIFLSGYTPGAISLTVGQGSFTVFVIIFYAIIAGPDITTGEVRVLDVGIGLAISLLVSALMWPRGVVTRVNSTLVESVQASSDYLVAAFERLVYGPDADARVAKASAAAQVAVSTANETFDMTIAQGRTQKPVGATWSFVANASSHITASANLVLYLASIGRIPTACPDSGALLVHCAHQVAANANAAAQEVTGRITTQHPQHVVSTQAFDPDRVDTRRMENLDASFHDLDARIDACLAYWQTKPDELRDIQFGEQALSIIWAEQWLLHLMWVSNKIREAFPTANTTA